MGLDLYAGPLTRYHAGLWKTIVQQMSEAEGIPVHMIRLNEPDEPATPEETLEAVVAWQRVLRQATGIEGIDWPESASMPYFTDKPDWGGYWAVMLLAASDQFPDIRAPDEIGRGSRLGDPSKHPLIKRSEEVYLGKSSGGLLGRLFGRRPAPTPAAELRYRHLLTGTELWLPAEFDEPFYGPDITGNRYWIGSAPTLLRELESLNARTLKGTNSILAEWAKEGPSDEDPSLRRMARFGLALLIQAARYAVENRVPLKLDY